MVIWNFFRMRFKIERKGRKMSVITTEGRIARRVRKEWVTEYYRVPRTRLACYQSLYMVDGGWSTWDHDHIAGMELVASGNSKVIYGKRKEGV